MQTAEKRDVREKARLVLRTHLWLMRGSCVCGARAEDAWQMTEHLADVIADELT